MELLPLKATFAPGEPLRIEVRGARRDGHAELCYLDAVVATAPFQAGDSTIEFAPQPPGGYGIDASGPDGGSSTALDVLENPLERLRYGFAANFAAGRDPAAAAEFARRLHLNAIQFYDWMHRHASLIPPADEYDDPLGRRLSRTTVRSLIDAYREIGTTAFGYVAVYAVGAEARSRWRDAALLRPDGSQWQLGEDFLWLVDPSDAAWVEHLSRELERARDGLGFGGFHLDQYGWPKRALRVDGREVDLADAFFGLLKQLRDRLGDTALIFNNVNAFPLWRAHEFPQDAVYVEPWSPHDAFADLAAIVTEARVRAPQKPAIIAAYLPQFGSDRPNALWAAKLTMATLFSHGAFHLLVGEEGAVLADPYYVNNERLAAPEVETLRRWYDFTVRYGDLLYDAHAVDVTKTVYGGINREIRIDGVRAVPRAEAGSIWLRVIETSKGLVLHLINLADQRDTEWAKPKAPLKQQARVRLSVLRSSASQQRFLFASPDGPPRFEALPATTDSGYDSVEVPSFATWAMVLITH